MFIGHLFSKYGFQVCATAGPSMVPTISARGNWVLIAKWYRRGRGIKPGDLVDLKSPITPGVGAIKRVMGMPGDFVEYEIISDSSNAMFDVEDGLSTKMVRGKKMIQIPEGHCWVLGDNLNNSRDSRIYGPLPLALVNGKVLSIVLPWRERSWFKNPLK